MTPDQIIQFLDDCRQLHGTKAASKSQLISMKVSENLLNVFKAQAAREGVPYHMQIKPLMQEWALDRRRG
jgi:predicted DNA binding CopG/RHH family protein